MRHACGKLCGKNKISVIFVRIFSFFTGCGKCFQQLKLFKRGKEKFDFLSPCSSCFSTENESENYVVLNLWKTLFKKHDGTKFVVENGVKFDCAV